MGKGRQSSDHAMEKLVAVLGSEVHQDIEFVQVFSGEVLDKRCVSDIVRQLSGLYPLPELGHLKRVKSGNVTSPKILISQVRDESCVEQEQTELEETLRNNVSIRGLGSISVVKVSKWKPITRRQYETAAQYWPTNFHEDKRLEKILRGEFFSTEEMAKKKEFMKVAITEARKVSERAETMCAAGAVIVDPTTDKVVAQAHTDSSHPLKHAVMMCIDNIAQHQGGGAWTSRNSHHSLCDSTIGESRLQQPRSGVGESTEGQTHHLECGMERLGQAHVEEDTHPPPAKRSKTSQYLCTGYDAYVVKEPCVMYITPIDAQCSISFGCNKSYVSTDCRCSMALLHSRIKSVFYGHMDPHYGGLGSQYSIHIQKGLNHHFEVYKGLLPGGMHKEQC